MGEALMRYLVTNPKTGSSCEVEASSRDHALHVAEMGWKPAPDNPSQFDMVDGYLGVWLVVEEAERGEALRSDLTFMASRKIIPNHWGVGRVQRTAQSALDEINRLREEKRQSAKTIEVYKKQLERVTEEAPHGQGCSALVKPGHVHYGPCNCWKSRI